LGLQVDLFNPRIDAFGLIYPPIIDKIDITEECWLWQGRRNSKGYGTLKSKAAGTTLAHRVVWIALVGPIEDGLELDHLCRVKHCVNPDHLDPVTLAENMHRSIGYRNRASFCVNGHDIAEVGRASNRQCRQCNRDNAREYQRRRRSAG